MNIIHVCAALTSLAHVWMTARRNPRLETTFKQDQPQASQSVETLYPAMEVKQLQPMVPSLKARDISTTLWASVKLNLKPDDFQPGILQTIDHQFSAADTYSKQAKGPCCTSSKAPYEQQCPTSEAAIFSVAVILGLVSMKHLQIHNHGAYPTTHEAANIVFFLNEFKFAPLRDQVVFALLNHPVARGSGWEPNSQDISNFFSASVQLNLFTCQAQSHFCFKYLFSLPVSKVSYQKVKQLCLVRGHLDHDMFDALLDQLYARRKQLLREHGTKGTSVQPARKEPKQIHQALESLRHPQDSLHMQAWSSLRSRLQEVAPAPSPTCRSIFFPRERLYDALGTLSLPYKARGVCGTYWADAVVSTHDSNVAEVILVLERREDHLTTWSSRAAAFRYRILGFYGTVVTVPHRQDSSGESMAGDIKAAVEAKIGLPLNSFATSLVDRQIIIATVHQGSAASTAWFSAPAKPLPNPYVREFSRRLVWW